MHNQTFYKIQHKETNLYSRGGTGTLRKNSIYWSKVGKVWVNTGSMRRHLALFFLNEYGSYREEDIKQIDLWIVIEFKIINNELEIKEFPAADFYHKNI